MATATPNFAQTPTTANAVTTSANTNLGAPSNTVVLFQAGASGAVIRKVTAIPRATSADSVLYLYTSGTGGVTQLLIAAVNAPAQTLSTTNGPTAVDFGFTREFPLTLDANEELYVGASVALAGGWSFRAEGADFA